MKAVFWLVMVLTPMSRSRFKQSRNLSAHSTYVRSGLFCKFCGDFWVYLGHMVFSKDK